MFDQSTPILPLQYADFQRVQRHKIPNMNLFLLSKTNNATAGLRYGALILIMVLGCERPEKYDMICILEVPRSIDMLVRSIITMEEGMSLTVLQRFRSLIEG
jgi:hypothetical protein